MTSNIGIMTSNIGIERGTDTGIGAPSTGSTTLLEEEVRLDNNDGDHERFSHYVRKEKILESAVTGKPVKALCGKKWVPNRDPVFLVTREQPQ